MVSLETRKLACGYGSHAVLRNVELSIRGPAVVSVVGPNGAGKTTLLRTLSRLLKPLEGSVLVDGKDVWDMDPYRVSQLISYMPPPPPRGFSLRAGDVAEILSGGFGPVARMLGVDELEDARIDELSSGQMQLLLAATTLDRGTPLVVMDEATAHLDVRNQIRLLNAMRITKEKTGSIILMSIHDLRLAYLYSDYVVLLGGGGVISSGPPSEALSPRHLSRAYGVPARVVRSPELGVIVVLG